MSLESVAARSAMTLAALISLGPTNAPSVHAQSTERGALPLPDEAAGIDGIVEALISVYDRFDVVALGEIHARKMDSDLRIALVRHPEFAKKVQTIVVEFATTAEQTTLDRYIRGEDVSRAELDRVRPREPGSLTVEDPVYPDFFAAVREVNSRLPADARIRVFGGEDNRNRDAAGVAILKEQALQRQGKALVIYGYAHFWRADVSGDTGGLVGMLDRDFPGRTFTVMPVGGGMDGVAESAYRKFDGAVEAQLRPVMVPLQRSPFRDFTAEEFLAGSIVTRRGGRWVSIFDGSTLTLREMADAVVYFGRP